MSLIDDFERWMNTEHFRLQERRMRHFMRLEPGDGEGGFDSRSLAEDWREGSRESRPGEMSDG